MQFLVDRLNEASTAGTFAFIDVDAVMDAAVYPANRSFIGGLVKGSEIAAHSDIFKIACIFKGKVVAKAFREHSCCGSRYCAVAAGMFRKGRCLQIRLPVFIE